MVVTVSNNFNLVSQSVKQRQVHFKKFFNRRTPLYTTTEVIPHDEAYPYKICESEDDSDEDDEEFELNVSR